MRANELSIQEWLEMIVQEIQRIADALEERGKGLPPKVDEIHYADGTVRLLAEVSNYRIEKGRVQEEDEIHYRDGRILPLSTLISRIEQTIPKGRD